ncbi:MAG TPA: acetate/propionate family kinase [Candidatus Eremiobacteraceae bacterium]|nr:acetate/propionate family kinase [Candidatus Eremiobacteraceae bacterium]
MPRRHDAVGLTAAAAYLACDAGSSSFKAALFEFGAAVPRDPQPARWEGAISWRRLPGSAGISSRWNDARSAESQASLHNALEAPARLLRAMQASAPPEPPAVQHVVHRIVHTGQFERSPARVSSAVRRAIASALPLAPEHNAIALAGIEAVDEAFPGVEQFIISDSAYHADMPLAASTYGVPASWYKVWGIRRLGFHGVSHGYAAQRAAQLADVPLRALKVVTCHLGNGCSLAATSAGTSVDTTMGWTPMEGLVMGQRSGSLDPGVMLYLMERGRYTARELARVLNEESGLKGISGLSGDMRELLEAVAAGHPHASLAFDVFVHRVRAGIGAMAASLGGLDAIVFTGGIGEHAHEVRRAVCTGLEFLGIDLDEEKDAAARPDCDVARASSRVRIFVVRARETWAMARDCALAVAQAAPQV